MLEACISAGATTVNIPDTVGYALPSEFAERIRLIKQNVPNIDRAVISVHCHNDLGNAAPNSIAAVMEGARQVEGCINGLGERAGNASLEEVIMTIETRSADLGVSTNIDTRQIYRTSRLVSDITGFQVQPNKAIVGANAFRHASGIHQDGVLKERTTFEIMDPQSVGWPSSSLVLGKLSGRAGLRARLDELGFQLTRNQLDEAFDAFKDLADRKREVSDADLEALMAAPAARKVRARPVQPRPRPGLLRRPRYSDRDRDDHGPRRELRHRRGHRRRPGRRRLPGDQPGDRGPQQADGVQGGRSDRGNRRDRRRDDQDRPRWAVVPGARLGYGHHRGERQGVHERAQQAAHHRARPEGGRGHVTRTTAGSHSRVIARLRGQL